MRVSGGRYGISLALQGCLLVADLLFNCAALFPRSSSALLVIFVFQDLLLVLGITAVLINFFSTYLFQAGLMEFLFDKFRSLAIVTPLYLFCSIGTHAYWSVAKWENPAEPVSTSLAIAILVRHTVAPCYYYFYKRAALKISDPRFYEDIDWMTDRSVRN